MRHLKINRLNIGYSKIFLIKRILTNFFIIGYYDSYKKFFKYAIKIISNLLYLKNRSRYYKIFLLFVCFKNNNYITLLSLKYKIIFYYKNGLIVNRIMLNYD